MNSATGFTIIWNKNAPPGSPPNEEQASSSARASAREDRMLAHFPELKKHSLSIGQTTLTLWGRGSLEDCIHQMPDGSWLALIGSPTGADSWQRLQDCMLKAPKPSAFRLPFEGRCVLLQISADGQHWRMWNDFLGSIPVFYTQTAHTWIASTLEPAVVAANSFSPNDFNMPAILFMMLHGHYYADWTMYKPMKVVVPDSVTEWDGTGVRHTACNTLVASDERYGNSWESLIEEAHSLIRKSVETALSAQPGPIVPLSSGLDSRLIAAVGTEAGFALRAFTWGPKNTRDTIYARMIAKALGIPWKRVDLGEDYFSRYLPVWVDLFGSAMHFHGMYQMPFLDALRSEAPGRLVSGFIGELLAGYLVQAHTDMHAEGDRTFYAIPEAYLHWNAEELKQLFCFPIDDAMDEIANQISEQTKRVGGEWHQKTIILTLRGRQHYFTYFQSMLCDYWRGVITPYINRNYANFWLSIPRALLDNRRLLMDMASRYYARIMEIPGTYGREPARLTGRYLLKRRLAQKLPAPFVARLLPEFAATRQIKTDVASLRQGGMKAIWPIREAGSVLSEWIHLDKMESVYQEALAGDIRSVRKIQSIQTLAYRLVSS